MQQPTSTLGAQGSLRTLTTSYKPRWFSETVSLCRAVSSWLLSVLLIQYTLGIG